MGGDGGVRRGKTGCRKGKGVLRPASAAPPRAHPSNRAHPPGAGGRLALALSGWRREGASRAGLGAPIY